MSTQYDFARPAKQVYPLDTARLHMASKTTSYLPPHHNPSRRVPVESTSLPHTSWLSEATEFNASPPSQAHLGLGPISAPGTDPVLGSGSPLGSSKPPRVVQRVRSRDYLLSTSPTSGTGTRSRHTPSPLPSPSHSLTPSRSFTVSSPHKASGMSSDQDASGHLDMKRLMSKPARQTPSGSVSLPSDSERSADASSSRVLASRRPSEGAISHPPLSRSANASREKVSLHVDTMGLRSSSAPRYGHASPERRPPATSDGQSGKSSRNVLRRRSSARSNPSGHSVTHSRVPTDEFTPPTRAVSTKRVQDLPRDDVPFAANVSRPAISPSVSARPTTSPQTKIHSSSSKRQVSAGLTPAGAVALAYKQQEQRREELAETASFNDAYRPASAQPILSLVRKKASQSVNDGEDESGGGPYYTVFGSASGRLVAVGSPEDDDLPFRHYEPRGIVTSHAKSASNSSRSLSRKVSGSLKRVTGSMKRERDHPSLPAIPNDEWKPYNSNPGHNGNSPSFSKSIRKPLVLDTSMQKGGRQDSPVTKMSPAPKSCITPEEDGRMQRSSKTKGKEREEDLSPGGKWWKLMKRISTGGLRDKYVQDEAVPPVPALPQNIPLTPSRTTMEIPSRGTNGMEVSENGVLLQRFMQSRASMSGVRPTLPPASKASPGSSRPSTGTAGRPSTANTTKSQGRASASGHHPSTATRSSSPSSEMASSTFFHHPNRTPSTRSSISSFGEEVPPMPKNVGQYIVPPSELSRITKSSVDPSPSRSNRSRTQSRAQTAPPEDTSFKVISSQEDRSILSLPLPPRRVGGVPSPLSPSFNVEDTINNLMPPQPHSPPPLTEFGMKEPPPRPKRSSRRAAPMNVDIPARSQSMSATMPASPQTPRRPPHVRVNMELMRRPSTGALSYASTAKQVSASSSTSPVSPPSSSTSPSSASQKRSPLNFRELESPRQRLTEKEKADKWNDLLERSAQAGGTLHLGEMHLLSDQPDTGDGASYRGYDSDS